jgi:hypothetical protein
MATEEKKRRFLTIELNPYMSDKEEARFKEWIADGINDMRYASENAVLAVPKIFLLIAPKSKSDIQVIKKKLVLTK